MAIDAAARSIDVCLLHRYLLSNLAQSLIWNCDLTIVITTEEEFAWPASRRQLHKQQNDRDYGDRSRNHRRDDSCG